MGPFAMLQDAALLRILHTPGAGLQTLAVYHMVSRSRTLREQGERVSNAAIGRALGISRTRVSEAMTWLRDHGLIDEDEHGLQAVVLDAVDLRESVRSTGRKAPKASAQPDAAPSAAPDGSSESVRSAGRSGVHEPSAQPDTTPHIERSTYTNPSSSDRNVDARGQAEEEEDNVVDLDSWRRRVESGDVSVLDISTDPAAPWIEFEHAPSKPVLDRLRAIGLQPRKREVFESGNIGTRSVYRWSPQTADAYRVLPAMLDAIRDLVESKPAPPPEIVPKPEPREPGPWEPSPEVAAAWAPVVEEFGDEPAVRDAVPEKLVDDGHGRSRLFVGSPDHWLLLNARHVIEPLLPPGTTLQARPLGLHTTGAA